MHEAPLEVDQDSPNKKPSRSKSSMVDEHMNSLNTTSKPSTAMLKLPDPIDEIGFKQDQLNQSLHSEESKCDRNDYAGVSPINRRDPNDRDFKDYFVKQPSNATARSQLRSELLLPNNYVIPEVNEAESHKYDEDQDMELPPLKFTETIELKGDELKFEDRQSESKPTRRTGEFFQAELSDKANDQSKISIKNKVIASTVSNEPIASSQKGFTSNSFATLDKHPNKIVYSDIEKSDLLKHKSVRKPARFETLEWSEEERGGNLEDNKAYINQETFNSNIASNVDGGQFTFNGSQGKPTSREIEQLNGKVRELQQELQAYEARCQKLKQQYDSKYVRMKEENDKLMQTNQSLLMKISLDEQGFQQKQREAESLNREILEYKKSLNSYALHFDANSKANSRSGAPANHTDETVRKLKLKHDEEVQNLHLSYKLQVEQLTNQLKSAQKPQPGFPQQGPEASISSAKEVQHLKQELVTKQQELAALHDKINSLQSALNESQYRSSSLPRERQDKEDTFLQMKYRHDDMVHKHAIMKKNVDQFEKRERDLRREIELYHSQLLALSDQPRLEFELPVTASPLGFADELELVRLRELEAVHESKIEELIQENIALREKLLDSEAKSAFGSLGFDDENVRSIEEENLSLKEEVYRLREKIVNLESRALDTHIKESKALSMQSKAAMRNIRRLDTRFEVEVPNSLDSPYSNNADKPRLGSRLMLPNSSLKYSTSITELDRKQSRGRGSLLTAHKTTSEVWKPIEFQLSAAQPAASGPDYRALLEEALESEEERRAFKEVCIHGRGFLVEGGSLAVMVDDMSMETVGLMKVAVLICSQTPVSLRDTSVSAYPFSTDISLPYSSTETTLALTYTISMEVAATVVPPKVSFSFETQMVNSILPVSVLSYVSFVEASLADLLELCEEELYEREETISGDHLETIGSMMDRFVFMVRDQDDYYLRVSSIAQASAVIKLSYASHRLSVAMKYSNDDEYLSSMFSLLTFLFAN